MPKKIQYSGLFLPIIRGRCVVAASQTHSYCTVFLTIVSLQLLRTSTGLATRMVLTFLITRDRVIPFDKCVTEHVLKATAQ